MLKYGFDDARPVLERASARETAARVAAGTIARAFLRQALGVEVLSHVISIGASAPYDGPPPQASDLAAIDASPVRAFDKDAEARMIAEIEAAKADGDTLGGIVEVVANGLPIGLGSFTSGDNRLDSQLAGAVMGIQAIKGVEIGDGFETARRRGSVAHDEMYPGPGGVMRSTNRAGGLEGGMTNGQPLRVRAAMKPISTVPRALATVDMATGDEAVAIHQRSDVCAVPAAGVVVETMVALVLARAALEKFGGDSLAETRANLDTYLRAVAAGREPSSNRAQGRRADGAQGGIDRDARLGQVHDRSPAGQDARRLAAGHRLGDRADHRPHHRRHLHQRRREGVPPYRGTSRQRTHWRSHDGVLSLGGGAITSPGVREALSGHTVVYLEISVAEGVRRTGGTTVRPLLAGGDRAEKFRTLMSQRVPLYRRAATIRVNTNRRNPSTRRRAGRARPPPPAPRTPARSSSTAWGARCG